MAAHGKKDLWPDELRTLCFDKNKNLKISAHLPFSFLALQKRKIRPLRKCNEKEIPINRVREIMADYYYFFYKEL